MEYFLKHVFRLKLNISGALVYNVFLLLLSEKKKSSRYEKLALFFHVENQ